MLIEEIKRIKSGKKDLRKFGITLGIVFGLLGGLLFWRNSEFFAYILILSAALFILGLFLPVLLKPLFIVWMGFATVMGWIMTRVILILLFYLVFTPIAFFARLLKKDPLNLKFDKNTHSYWIPKKTMKIDRKNYENQY